MARRRHQRPRRPKRGRRKNGAGEPNGPPDHALGRSRGGFGTKVHLLTDGNGLPLAATLTAGQAHESTQLEALLARARVGGRRRPQKLAGDKGYSYPRVRRLLWSRGVKPVIPRRRDQVGKWGRPACFKHDSYRRRNAAATPPSDAWGGSRASGASARGRTSSPPAFSASCSSQ